MALRVAMVLDGEVGRDMVALVRELTALDVEATVVAAPGSAEPFAGIGVTVTPLTVGVGSVSSLRRVVRDVDVVHAQGLRAGIAASLARVGDTPLVVGWFTPAHLSGMSGLAWRTMARTVASAADLTIAASIELIATATRLGARDVRLAPVAAPELPDPTRRPDEVREELGVTGPMVLGVGRLQASNHYDVLVSAAARWRYRRPVPQVVIAGTGPAYRDLVAQAAVSRAPVIFAGHRDDVADLLRAADIAVVLAERVRPPFALEAARAGVALVAASGGGLVDLLDGSAALVSPPGDVDALDDAVRRLLDDPPARAMLAAAGRARAAMWPSATEAAARIAAWYAELSGETGGRRDAGDHVTGGNRTGTSRDAGTRDAPGPGR